jgi:hypothetical protein
MVVLPPEIAIELLRAEASSGPSLPDQMLGADEKSRL